MSFTGAIKDQFDSRDYRIGDYLTSTEELPKKIDWSGEMLPVRDQGNEPACVAFAAAAVKESEEHEGQLSPRFLYERIKQPQGGAFPRDVVKILQKEGVPPESCYPYVPNRETKPCPNWLEFAIPNRIKGYARLNTIDEMKRCLYESGSFIAAFYINDSWVNPENGIVRAGGNITGGHAVAICGYDEDKQLLKFKNSWGETWGAGGYGFISYSDAISSLMDAWSSVDIPESEEQQTEPTHTEIIIHLLKSIWGIIIDIIKMVLGRWNK